MNSYNILFNSDGKAIIPSAVRNKIVAFAYTEASYETICDSARLDKSGEVFIKCTARILSNFGMTRSGPFKGLTIDEKGCVTNKKVLVECWKTVGNRLTEIHNSVSGYSRDRYILEIRDFEREELIAKIWSITKQLLPVTMGKTSYGLVGASKILFAVLPEIVLPIDNSMWLNVFKTVDLGDVLV